MTAPLTPASPSRRQWLHTASASSLAMALPAWAQTSAWPSKPLRLVVPFAPGGSSEIVARSVAGEMAKTIGQNVFVDNKPGAAGNIATSPTKAHGPRLTTAWRCVRSRRRGNSIWWCCSTQLLLAAAAAPPDPPTTPPSDDAAQCVAP